VNDFMKQLSSYNLLNCLLPGVVFVELGAQILELTVPRDNLLVAAFMYYFVGLLVSRAGSLILEPFLKGVGFVVFADHFDFVKASKVDSKIDVLTETNNTYRTMAACVLLLLVLEFWQWFVGQVPVVARAGVPMMSVAVAMLLLFSYRKQTNYIRNRVEANEEVPK